MPNVLTIVVSEPRPGDGSDARFKQVLLREVRGQQHLRMKVVPHLYDLSPEGAAFRFLKDTEGDLAVLAWLYPRATYWVLDANGVKGRMGQTGLQPDEDISGVTVEGERTIWCLDLRHRVPDGVLLDELDRVARESTGLGLRPKESIGQSSQSDDADSRSDHEGVTDLDAVRVVDPTHGRWYPVVDRARCGNCLECLNFCLFGVYGLDADGRLFVEVPDACRNGCPACARVCPQGAIIFPSHHNPAIAGDAKFSPADITDDLVQLLGPLDPTSLATAERRRILGENGSGLTESQPADGGPGEESSSFRGQRSSDLHSAGPTASVGPQDLDELVDELDRSDL
ncbi:MAG: ATP-binding protein [Planctomycetota bacterium]